VVPFQGFTSGVLGAARLRISHQAPKQSSEPTHAEDQILEGDFDFTETKVCPESKALFTEGHEPT